MIDLLYNWQACVREFQRLLVAAPDKRMYLEKDALDLSRGGQPRLTGCSLWWRVPSDIQRVGVRYKDQPGADLQVNGGAPLANLFAVASLSLSAPVRKVPAKSRPEIGLE